MTQKFVCSAKNAPVPDSTVAETADGRIRGFQWNGIYTFHGIPYATAKRFCQPVPTEKWEGTIDALNYGYVAPVTQHRRPTSEVKVPHRMWIEGEDCLSLNVWTPGINDGLKRPVLVWLHGGGFEFGSSIEQACYDGKNLAMHGNAVVVTVNHRLNVFGFLDLSKYGEQFENSGNAGMADIVEALRWVQRNIFAFGGDPKNVTLFGQSGGAMKIMTLGQIPAADNLYRRGVMLSGTAPADVPAADEQVISELLCNLGLRQDEASKLADVPLNIFLEAYRRAEKHLNSMNVFPKWGPHKNGWYLGNPFEVGLTESAKNKPMILGSVFAEMNRSRQPVADKHQLSEAQCRACIEEKFGEAANAVMDAFRAAYPDKSLLDILCLDNRFRMHTIRYLDERLRGECAPTYSYMFAPDFAIDGGTPAWHCSDLPFIFHNTDLIPYCWGIDNTKALETQMAGALAQFAKTGNPNGDRLACWPAYEANRRTTLVMDASCHAEDNFDDALYQRLFERNDASGGFWDMRLDEKARGLA